MNNRGLKASRRIKITRKGWAILVAITLIVLAAAGIIAISILNADSPAKLSELPFNSSTNYGYSGNGFYYFDGSELVLTETGNDEPTRMRVSSTEVKLAASPSIGILYNTNAVHLINAAYPIELTGTVMSAKCGSGHIAVLKEENNQSALMVFNSNSEQTDRMDFAQTSALDFGFDTISGETLWTLETDVSASMPMSILTTYDTKKRATTGKINIQNQLVEDVAFTENSIFVIGTNHLIRYDRVKNTESYRELCYGRKLVDCSVKGEYPLFVFSDRGDSSMSSVVLYRVKDTDVADTSTHRIQLPSNTLTVCAMGGRLVVVTTDAVLTYSNTGKPGATSQFETPITGALKLSDSMLIVERQGVLYQCNFS